MALHADVQPQDRLVDFARENNHQVIADFQHIRADVLAGRFANLATRLLEWRRELESLLKWEEGPVFEAYLHRCAQDDRQMVRQHAREHLTLLKLIEDLNTALEASIDPSADADVRHLLDTIDAELMEHRNVEENQICLALDFALDAPTIGEIEDALAHDPQPGRKR